MGNLFSSSNSDFPKDCPQNVQDDRKHPCGFIECSDFASVTVPHDGEMSILRFLHSMESLSCESYFSMVSFERCILN